MIKKATLLHGMALNPQFLYFCISETLCGEKDLWEGFEEALGIDHFNWFLIEVDLLIPLTAEQFVKEARSTPRLQICHVHRLVRWAFAAGYLEEASRAKNALVAANLWREDP